MTRQWPIHALILDVPTPRARDLFRPRGDRPMTTDTKPDYEPTNDAAFGGDATSHLGDATELATNDLASQEGQPETPDNEGENTDDETPPLQPEPRGPGGTPPPDTEGPAEPEPAPRGA